VYTACSSLCFRVCRSATNAVLTFSRGCLVSTMTASLSSFVLDGLAAGRDMSEKPEFILPPRITLSEALQQSSNSFTKRRAVSEADRPSKKGPPRPPAPPRPGVSHTGSSATCLHLGCHADASSGRVQRLNEASCQALAVAGHPWTEEEHASFLEGLQRFGKGSWLAISRHCVKTRNPTQIASHAQKYFLRVSQGVARSSRFTAIEQVRRAALVARMQVWWRSRESRRIYEIETTHASCVGSTPRRRPIKQHRRGKRMLPGAGASANIAALVLAPYVFHCLLSASIRTLLTRHTLKQERTGAAGRGIPPSGAKTQRALLCQCHTNLAPAPWSGR